MNEPPWIEAALAAKRRIGAVPPGLIGSDPRKDAAFNGDTATLERLASAPVGSALAAVAEARRRAGLALAPRGWRLGPGETVFDEQIEYGAAPAFVRSDPAWRDGALDRGRTVLERFRAGRRSDTCVIAGNGPSLNLTELDQLDGRADLLISNYAFRHPLLRERAALLAVVNALVAEQESERLNLIDGPLKVFPYWLSHVMREECGAVFVRAPGGEARFHADLETGFSWSSTVSFFLMQLAFWVGYRRALLIGFDHAYRQPEGLREGEILAEAGADANHFDPAYFQGKRWQAADPDMMAAAYRLAQTRWRADGRDIVNCTVGGALEVFPRADLRDELAGLIRRRPPAALEGMSWETAGVLREADEGAYGHVVVAVNRLRLGPLFWPRLVLKLHRAPGEALVELRREDSSPFTLASWPEGAPDHLLLKPGGVRATLGAADRWLDPTDQRALRSLVAATPRWLDEVTARSPGALRPFAGLRDRFASLAGEAA